MDSGRLRGADWAAVRDPQCLGDPQFPKCKGLLRSPPNPLSKKGPLSEFQSGIPCNLNLPLAMGIRKH